MYSKVVQKVVTRTNIITLNIPKTKSEYILKAILKAHGFKLWHNKKCHGFYPDLWIMGTKILIEVDGEYHFTDAQKAKDKARSKILNSYGFTVIRCTNSQVLRSPDKIVERIKLVYGKNKRLQNSN